MPGSSQAGGPAFFFSPRFPAGSCVKVSDGFQYKLPSNLGRFQRFPFQGGSAPFCGAGFVEQNLGRNGSSGKPPPPLSAPLPLVFYQLGRRFSLRSIFRENHLPTGKRTRRFTLVRLVGLAAHSFPDGKKRVGRLSAQISPVFPQRETAPTRV